MVDPTCAWRPAVWVFRQEERQREFWGVSPAAEGSSNSVKKVSTMWLLQGFLSLLGRLMMCSIFIMAAVAGKIPNFEATVAEMEAKNIPNAKIMLIAAIALLIAGSLMIIIGYKGRIGALLLLVFLGLATFYFHDFWNNEETRDTEILHFMKNLSIAGALVFILGNGSGSWALDSRDASTDEDFL